jgi:hypothetical protein
MVPFRTHCQKLRLVVKIRVVLQFVKVVTLRALSSTFVRPALLALRECDLEVDYIVTSVLFVTPKYTYKSLKLLRALFGL